MSVGCSCAREAVTKADNMCKYVGDCDGSEDQVVKDIYCKNGGPICFEYLERLASEENQK